MPSLRAALPWSGPIGPSKVGPRTIVTAPAGNRYNSAIADGHGRRENCASTRRRGCHGLAPRPAYPDVLDDGRGAGSEALARDVIRLDRIRAKGQARCLEARLPVAKSDRTQDGRAVQEGDGSRRESGHGV